MAYVFKELAIADFNELINKPIINADLDNTSASNADLTVLYHHVGSSTETYKKTVLYYSDGTAWCEFKGTPGKDGKDGKDGPPGADGKDGKDGSPGKDGAPGADGKDGVGVVSAQLTKIE